MSQNPPIPSENLGQPRARVFTLGRFQIELDGQPLRFGPKAQRRPLELLKLLIALGGVSVSVEQATDSLWPDLDGQQAQGAFASALHRLRRLIGREALHLADGRLTLDPNHCRVDAEDFRDSLEAAARAAEEGDGQAAWSHVEHALSLYRGPFLEGEFVPVEILPAREKLHSLFLRQIQVLSEYYAGVGDSPKAIVLYQRGLEVDELAEEFYRGLMRCYQAVGRLGEAVSLFQRCREVLRAAAGIDPAPETEAVYQAVIAGEGDTLPVPPPGSVFPGEIPPPPGSVASVETPPAPGATVAARLRRAARAFKGTRRRLLLGAAAAGVVLLGAAFGGWMAFGPPKGEAQISCLQAAAAPALPKQASIAVMAFDNLTGDPEQEYYSDALTENIITQLAEVQGLFVIARHSTFKYKGRKVTPQQVGRELGVRYVLEGGVQKNDQAIRITVQLIDAGSGKHLWAEHYDGKLKGMFDFQDGIVQRIAFALDTQLLEGDAPLKYRPQNPEAFDLVARALRHYLRHRRQDNRIAQNLLAQAIALDANSGRVLLGWTHFDDARYGWSASRPASLELAHRLGMEAIAQNENHFGGYGLMSYVFMLEKDFDKAIAMGQKALALVPNHALNLQRMASLMEYGGRPKEAVDYICRAIRLNPFYPVLYLGTLGDSYRLIGEYDQAIAVLKKAIERRPSDVLLARVRLVAAYMQAGRKVEGREVARQILKLQPRFSLKRYERSRLYRDRAVTGRLIAAMREAGLPD